MAWKINLFPANVRFAVRVRKFPVQIVLGAHSGLQSCLIRFLVNTVAETSATE